MSNEEQMSNGEETFLVPTQALLDRAVESLRRSAVRALDDASPFRLEQLDGAIKVVEALEYVRRREERQKEELRQKSLPPGYQAMRGENLATLGFEAPDGRAYGFWDDSAEMRENAWCHFDDPNGFVQGEAT